VARCVAALNGHPTVNDHPGVSCGLRWEADGRASTITTTLPSRGLVLNVVVVQSPDSSRRRGTHISAELVDEVDA
jgi:hypothetical protein